MQEISQVRKRESALASRCSKSCGGWILFIPAHSCLGRWIALGFLGLSTSWLPEPRKLFKKILSKVESGFYLQSRCQKQKFTIVYRIVTMELGLPPADGSNNDNNGNQVQIASNGPQPVDRQGVAEDDRIEDTSESAAQDTNAPIRVLDPNENAPNEQGQASAQRANNRPKPAKLTGLRQYMEKTREGKQILDSYATYGRLKNTVRSSLVRFIIKREEDRAFKTIKAHEKLKKWNVTHDRLRIYAEEVEYEFDGEIASTYFVEAQKVNGEYIRASGKLLAHLGYRIGKLKALGHLKENESPENLEIVMTNSLEEKVRWFGINTSPEKTLRLYLDDTRPYRRKLLIIDKIEVHEYLTKFLCFRLTEIAVKWFSRDFDALQPGKSAHMQRQWPIVRHCLYEELKSQKLTDPQDLAKLELIKSDKLNDDEINTTIGHLMPLVIDPKRSSRKRRSGDAGQDQNVTVSKYSVTERRDSFLHVISTVTELEADLNDYRAQLRAKHLTFQPTLVVIGTPLSPKSHHVILNDLVFNCASFLDALDLTFKLYYVLDCQPTTTILSRPMSPPTLSRPPPAATLSRSATPIAPPKLATMSTKVTSRIEPKCKSCFKVFEEEVDVYRHILNRDCPKLHDTFVCHVPNCDRQYSSANSFRKHVLRAHSYLHIQNQRQPKEPRLDVDPVQDEFQSQVPNSNQELDAGIASQDEEEEGYSESISSDSDEEFGVDDSDYFSSDDFGNESLFERENVECAADFVSKLFMYPNIPRKTVTKVINDSSNLLDQLLDRISHEIVQVSKTDNLDPNTISVVRNLIETYKNPLETFNTDNKCLKYFAKSDTFVPPGSYIIGERHDYRKKDGEMSLAHVPVCVQFIPLRKVLKKFLELPGLFERLTEYLQELLNDKFFISNVVQGSIWESYFSISSCLLVMPLLIYFDDYENNNPIGSHRGLNKCGAVYASIPCLPPEYQAKIENIFLFLLFNTLDRAVYSNKMTFAKAIEELNFLQTEGITLDLPGGPVKVVFRITNLIGDNLGIHTICNYVQYFRTKFFCHLCLTEYCDISNKLSEDDCVMRNPDNYSELLALNDPQESGMDGECEWNKLDNFHATINIGEDVMHDWYEGNCRHDVAIALYNLIYEQKVFKLADLNSRLRSFYYGPKGSTNKPPGILDHQVKNKHLIMTSAEMHNLVTRLPMVIGMIVPENNEILQFLIQLKRIIDIISSKVVQPQTHNQLKVHISEYLEMRRELFEGEKGKLKHHLGLHGPSSMKEFGPLIKSSALRFEAKNQEGKVIARTARTRINVCRTIAIRHQLLLNYRLRLKKPQARIETAEKKSIVVSKLKNISEFYSLLPVHDPTAVVSTVKWVNTGDDKICKNSILLLFDDGGPVFYLAHELIVIDDAVHIISKKLSNCYAVERIHGYKVVDKHDFCWSSLTLNDLHRASITYLTTLPDGGTYIYQNWIE
ncbi:hypothetical protein QAD02_004370 [Eretmocerus hayati]|uniref:Uncharacterized protein n=1 Tax=Eretmocerus hayati TaxID=131215 RepID=A0ACC2NPT8_9HYME|nr:hypothetical protein QAD02_004370 [Eretmocerus hayati]